MSLDMDAREEASHYFEKKVIDAAKHLKNNQGGETTIPCDSCKDAQIRVKVSRKAGTIMAQCDNYNDPSKRLNSGSGCGNPKLMIT